ncbi:hypothetical protein JCM16303_000433 [Sporobolomyces ruberrimus]
MERTTTATNKEVKFNHPGPHHLETSASIRRMPSAPFRQPMRKAPSARIGIESSEGTNQKVAAIRSHGAICGARAHHLRMGFTMLATITHGDPDTTVDTTGIKLQS